MPHSKFKLEGHPIHHKTYKHKTKRHRKDKHGLVNRNIHRRKKGNQVSSAVGALKAKLINNKKNRVNRGVHNMGVRDIEPDVQPKKKHWKDLSVSQQNKLHDKLVNNPTYNLSLKKEILSKAIKEKARKTQAANVEHMADEAVLNDHSGVVGVFKSLYHGLDEKVKSELDKHNVLGLIDPFLIVGFPALLFLLYRLVMS